jgi:hypothetical protein
LPTRSYQCSRNTGAEVLSKDRSTSELLTRVTTKDPDLRMPPEGPGLSAVEIAAIEQWVRAGLPWEQGFSFGAQGYEPPLLPRRPELPAPSSPDRTHPIDRILDADRAARSLAPLGSIKDEVFIRRLYLDLIGLLPTPEQTQAFLADPTADKRVKLIRSLLDRDIEYTEHWLTFWNDQLRNDYSGTGFITGGRTQISKWLYEALINNKPYDAMARELIAPLSGESAGFANGIRWRGEVSAGQTVEIQFAQSLGQAFLGIAGPSRTLTDWRPSIRTARCRSIVAISRSVRRPVPVGSLKSSGRSTHKRPNRSG